MRRQSLFSLFIFFSFHCVLGLGPASSDIQYLIGYNHGSFVVEKHRLSQGVFPDLSLISFFLFPGATAGMMHETWVGHLS